jgi:hypothetical protein
MWRWHKHFKFLMKKYQNSPLLAYKLKNSYLLGTEPKNWFPDTVVSGCLYSFIIKQVKVIFLVRRQDMSKRGATLDFMPLNSQMNTTPYLHVFIHLFRFVNPKSIYMYLYNVCIVKLKLMFLSQQTVLLKDLFFIEYINII